MRIPRGRILDGESRAASAGGAPDELSPDELRDRIRSSSSHARADRDLELLARPELRPVRLLLEFLKPELAFEDHGVENTIVVFGSTQLIDPEAAREQLERAEAAASDPDDDPDVRRARVVLSQSRYYEIGRELGRIIGNCGRGPHDNRLVLVTGGGPGAMEAANRGAHDVDAASAGLNITLPREQHPNPFITPELSFQFRYFGLRKLHFMIRARALIVLPGGYGTLDELFETLCLIQTQKRSPLPVILIGEEFWGRLIDFDFLVEAGMIDAADLSFFQFAETAEDAWDKIHGWYEDRGRSVFDTRRETPEGEDS